MSLTRLVRAPTGAGGVVFAIVLVLALMIAALGIGWLVSSALAALLESAPGSPQLPAWSILVFTLIALAPLLILAARIFPWIVNWYYLLPALVFLLAFTVYPIVLTVGYAFTNYSGKNSGEPDTSSRLQVSKVSATSLRIAPGVDAVAELGCEKADCAGQRIALRPVEREGASVDDRRLRQFTIQTISNGVIELDGSMPEVFTPELAHRVTPIQYVGFKNFEDIFAKASIQLWPVFVWTIIFAVATTLINVFAGLVLGILLNNKRLKFRNLYRTLLFLPWAIPAVISVQVWKDGLLAQNTGAINRVLGLFDGSPVPWLTDDLWAKVAILLVNLWLGFPYMMTATLGALATIPDELYEAAEVDGASKWMQIRAITLPMLTAAFTPIMLSSFAFNFNNFGIVYLLTGGGPALPDRLSTAQSTDILISWGYNTAFAAAGQSAYGPASAIALIVAVLTIGISILNFRFAGVFKEARR